MTDRNFSWSRNLTLVTIALALGAIAMFGDPYPSHVVTLNTKELATMVASDVDHVPVRELADWIIQGKTDYRLIDIRSMEEYAEYHIPTAEPATIRQIPEYPLNRNEKIVLYCNWGVESTKAWFLLKAQGYPGVYHLKGGIEEWKEDVLFPSIPDDATAEQIAEFETLRHVSSFFGGKPRDGGTATPEQELMPMPKVEAPTQAPITARKPKRKEGC